MSSTSNTDKASVPVVILAAGQNSRFFPLNADYHKGFIPLLGKPLVMHQIENLYAHGFHKLILVVSPRDNRAEYIQDMLSKTELYGMDISLVEQKQALGMGDALLQVKQQIQDRFAVVFPYHVSAGDVLHELLPTHSGACVSVVKTNEPWLYGVIKTKGNQAAELVEKPPKGTEPSNLKVQGIYVLTRDFLNILSGLAQEEYVFETALNQLMQEQEVDVFTLKQPLPTLKYPWNLFTMHKELFHNRQTSLSSQATIAGTALIDDHAGPVVIDEGATISHAARIVGPSYIGRNALVGDFSLVRESSVEENVKIGVHADITRSIFLPHASFHGGGFVGDSIIGEGTKIGAGLITANKRFDRALIKTRVKDKTVETSQKALGTIIGAHAKLGVRVTTMPGVMIDSQQVIKPNTLISRNMIHRMRHPGGSEATDRIPMT